MEKIGLIGLGSMGYPIGVNLLKKGFALSVTYHNNFKPAEELRKLGAEIYKTPYELASRCSIVLLVVPSEKEVEELIFGPQGLKKSCVNGLVVLDLSTIDLFASRDFALRTHPLGIRYIDSPISGGPKRAESAVLTIMVGALEAECESVVDVLYTIGSNIFFCGGQGLGMAAKIANNLIVSASIAAISEAFSISIKAGIDPSCLYAVLKSATANSNILNAIAPNLLSGNYSPAFRLRHMWKDLGIITSTAKKLGVFSPVSSIIEQLFVLSLDSFGELDCSALSLLYQEQAKVSFM